MNGLTGHVGKCISLLTETLFKQTLGLGLRKEDDAGGVDVALL